MVKAELKTIEELEKSRGPDKGPRKRKIIAHTTSKGETYYFERDEKGKLKIYDRPPKDVGKSYEILTPFEKADVRLTKDEAREWINLRIKDRAKEKIRCFIRDKKKAPTVDCIAKKVYEDLVEDWTRDNYVLEASRAVVTDDKKVSLQDHVNVIVSQFFDTEGKLLERMGKEGDKESKPEPSGTTITDARDMQYSLISLDEAYDLEKGRGPDKQPRKKRGRGKKEKSKPKILDQYGYDFSKLFEKSLDQEHIAQKEERKNNGRN
ncbi:hypothetical protein A2Z67_02825 [Candidatus Woesebacteria bacterium RBG_13_36_22]|uniref:Uncharacterized protein n=1 Tax=Candidatus Woesebacteria bacterium RBG_13_36_22 TaxID=1802478 RepID=A0A1F7X6A6_9BACT|nr:MAG: hypothetical protein A2Z67_02825 [Candidatus Woesebacteria bacterium RBG_13_36_22]